MNERCSSLLLLLSGVLALLYVGRASSVESDAEHASASSHTVGQVVPEPVDKWQKVQASNGSMSVNLLEAFYREPSRFAYTFQNYVFLTRLVQVWP